MRSFQDPERTFFGQPPTLGVLLQRVDVGSGRQGLYENQLPQLLQRLARQTKVESITASNAIEGVEVDPRRAEALAGGNPPRFRNRSEKEFAGYADALDGLMREPDLEPPTVPRLLEFHRKVLAHNGRGGHLKREDNKIATENSTARRGSSSSRPQRPRPRGCSRASVLATLTPSKIGSPIR